LRVKAGLLFRGTKYFNKIWIYMGYLDTKDAPSNLTHRPFNVFTMTKAVCDAGYYA
jgi:hypothetical protein